MLAVYSDDNMLHDPEQYISRGIFVPARELPQRATELLAALKDGGHAISAPRTFGLAPLMAVHDLAYIELLQTAHERWLGYNGPAGPMAVPQCYAMRHMGTRPVDPDQVCQDAYGSGALGGRVSQASGGTRVQSSLLPITTASWQFLSW